MPLTRGATPGEHAYTNRPMEYYGLARGYGRKRKSPREVENAVKKYQRRGYDSSQLQQVFGSVVSQDSEATPFCKLPLELLLKIFSYVLTSTPKARVNISYRKARPSAHPRAAKDHSNTEGTLPHAASFLRISRASHTAAAQVLYGTNAFGFESFFTLSTWLDAIGSTNASYIRNIAIWSVDKTYASFEARKALLKLADLCTAGVDSNPWGLRRLEFGSNVFAAYPLSRARRARRFNILKQVRHESLGLHLTDEEYKRTEREINERMIQEEAKLFVADLLPLLTALSNLRCKSSFPLSSSPSPSPLSHPSPEGQSHRDTNSNRMALSVLKFRPYSMATKDRFNPVRYYDAATQSVYRDAFRKQQFPGSVVEVVSEMLLDELGLTTKVQQEPQKPSPRAARLEARRKRALEA